MTLRKVELVGGTRDGETVVVRLPVRYHDGRAVWNPLTEAYMVWCPQYAVVRIVVPMPHQHQLH